MTCGARATVLPDALRHNFALLRARAADCPLMVAVKGNAYGHGLLLAAQAFAAADSLAIARLCEAEALRSAGIRQPLVLLAGVGNADEMARAVELDCELVVHSHAQLPLLESGSGRSVVWLKIDTGMHRLGFAPAEAGALIKRLGAARGVRELRLMTHLANAEFRGDPYTAHQLDLFRETARGFPGDISIANSAALFDRNETLADAREWHHGGRTWVRPGIALYGISPFPGQVGRELGLRPAMRFESRLVDVKPLARGEPVGYGGQWRAAADTWLGIIAAGYADGYSRFLPSGTPVLVNGRRVPLAGVVSMDLAAVDLGPDADDRPGDPVVLWGEELPVEEVARQAGTIPYQLVTGILHREAPSIA